MIRLDWYVNSLTGLGTTTRDKVVGGASFALPVLSGHDCDDRWRGSELGHRIVESHPRAMLRQGWDLLIQPPPEELAPEPLRAAARAAEEAGRLNDARHLRRLIRDVAEARLRRRDSPEAKAIARTTDAMRDRARDLGLRSHLMRALNYERAFGGAVIYVGAQDGRDPAEPLDTTAIRTISHLTTFAGGIDQEVTAYSSYSDPRAPKFGEPEIYQVTALLLPTMPVPGVGGAPQTTTAPSTWYVHESRLLVFPGNWTTRRARSDNRGWGDSVFLRVEKALSEFGQSWSAIAHLLSDWAQGVLKVPGLWQMLAERNEELIQRRSAALDMSRSIARSLVIDSAEEFHRDTVSLGGVEGLFVQIWQRLAAAADMPVTILAGTSPAGLNATGESDTRGWYDACAGQQSDHLTPQVERWTELQFLAADGPTRGEVPEQWSVEQRPLWQMSDKEKADIRKTVADTDQIYYSLGALSAEEIRRARFGGSQWSMETTIEAEETTPAAEGETPEIPGQGAPPAGATETTKPGGIDLTSTAQGAIVTVNEARAQLGLRPLTTATGAPDPDGALTIAVFTARRASTIATAAAAEAGEAPGAAPVVPPAS